MSVNYHMVINFLELKGMIECSVEVSNRQQRAASSYFLDFIVFL